MRTFQSSAVLALLLSALCLGSASAWALTSDMVVVKTAPATVVAGNNITYTIQVTNNGPDPATNAFMSDAVPAGTTFVSFTPDPTYACGALPPVGGTGGITCSNGAMAVGTANFTLVVHVPASTLDGTAIGNVAQTGSSNTESAPGDELSVKFTTVVASPDLAVAKTGPPTVTAGQNATYTITVVNTGVSDAQNVTLFDPLPPGTTWVTGSQDSGPTFSCAFPSAGATGVVNCGIATLAAGAGAQFTIQLAIDPSAPNGFVISNNALAFTDNFDPDAADNSSTTNATVQALADLRVIKVAPATATAGQNMTFNLTIMNLGPSNSQNATLFDVVPAGTTFQAITQTGGPTFGCTVPAVGGSGTVICSIAALASGATATFDLVVAVDSSVPSGSVIGNGANASSPTTTDPNPANDTEFTATTVASSANIGVSKSGPASATAGTDISYLIAAGNGGPSDAANFTLDDVIPAGTTFVSGSQTGGPPFSCTFPAVGGTGTMSCNIASLPAGQLGTFSLVVNLPAAVAGGTVVSNTATGSSATPDPVPGDNSSTVLTTAVTSADLQMFKNGPASVTAGTNITYLLSLFNAGPSNALSVNISDTLPANTTFVSYTQNTGPSFTLSTPAVGGTGTVTSTLASLPPGGSATFTLVLAVAPSAPNASSIANTTTVSSTTTDPVPGNNSATSTATVIASADLQVAKSGPASITAGTNITYTLSLSNAGTSDAQAVSLSDSLPANTTFVSFAQNTGPAFTLTTPAVGGTGTVTATLASLPAGGSATFTLVLGVAAAAANGSSLANTATVSSTTTDPTPGNNSATSTATVLASADVSVTKSGPATIDAGGNITYTLTVANAGPSDAQAVSLSDTLPANTTFVSYAQSAGPAFTLTTPAVGGTGTVTSTLGSLASGASATFTLVLKVASATASGSSIANTATVSSTTTDPTPGNNSATSTATVTTSADLQVTKTGPASAPTSSVLTYNLSLLNAGPSDALTVSFSDVLPAGTTFVSFTQNTGPVFTCTTPAVGGTGTVTCTMASLPATAGGMFTLVLQALPSLLGGSVVTNTATATSTTTDPTPANNSATATTNITAITSFSGPSPTGSGTITATFTGGGPACAFATAAFIAVTGDPGSPKAALSGVTFPHGLFSFTTSNCTPGSTLTFTITYPSSVERMNYWKFGPEPGAPKPHWYILPATFTGQVATFSITDGQLGDDDLLANGAIVDQGGPGVGGPAIPTLSEWMQLLLAALLLAMGIVAMGRRRRI